MSRIPVLILATITLIACCGCFPGTDRGGYGGPERGEYLDPGRRQYWEPAGPVAWYAGHPVYTSPAAMRVFGSSAYSDPGGVQAPSIRGTYYGRGVPDPMVWHVFYVNPEGSLDPANYSYYLDEHMHPFTPNSLGATWVSTLDEWYLLLVGSNNFEAWAVFPGQYYDGFGLVPNFPPARR